MNAGLKSLQLFYLSHELSYGWSVNQIVHIPAGFCSVSEYTPVRCFQIISSIDCHSAAQENRGFRNCVAYRLNLFHWRRLGRIGSIYNQSVRHAAPNHLPCYRMQTSWGHGCPMFTINISKNHNIFSINTFTVSCQKMCLAYYGSLICYSSVCKDI